MDGKCGRGCPDPYGTPAFTWILVGFVLLGLWLSVRCLVNQSYVQNVNVLNFNFLWAKPRFKTCCYPLANEVSKGYSNATVLPSVRPSFRNILVNTLESPSFNGFWPNLVHT